MRQEAFKANYVKLCVAYQKETGKATMRLYWGAFKHLSEQMFTDAVDKAIGTCEFFPTVAKLNMILEEYIRDIPTEEDVLNDLKKALIDYGIYSSPVFTYPVSHAIAEAVGWKTLCNSTPESFNNMVHYRYGSVVNEYKNSLRDNKPFPINRIKGLFEERGEKVKLPSGQTGYIQRGTVHGTSLKEAFSETEIKGD